MRCRLSRDFRFEAAHFLPRVPEDHKCRRMHGHSYQVRVTVEGEIDPAIGWLIDFAAVDAAVDPLVARLDHRVLNEIEGLDNPTSENLARWLWIRLVATLPGLAAVAVEETCTARCIYRGG